MYSGSNSFLGGTNSARPGQPPFAGQQQFGQQPQQQPQYGQQQQQQQQQPQYGQQQQPTQYGQQQPFLSAQSTGFAAPLQPQFTAYGQPQQQQQQQQQPPVPQLPQQYTAQQVQPTGLQQQQPLQPQHTQFQQQPIPQQQTFQQQPAQPAAPQQAPQPTGMTSSQVANSFRGSSSQPPPMPSSSGGSKIPNIRLSFITATDQAKFEQLFKSAVGTGQSMTGEQARDLLMRSKLTGDALAHIWTLADTTKSGHLLFPEFALAMYLCNLRLNSKELPSSIPEKIKNEVSSMVDIISFGVPDDKPLPPIQSNAPNFFDSRQSTQSPPVIQQPQPQQSNTALLTGLTSQPTGMMPQMTGYPGQMGQIGQVGMAAQQTGLQPQMTGFGAMPQATGYNGPRPPMPPMPTGYGQNALTAPLNSQPTGMPGQWGLVNAPATGLPNIDALHRQMMPQAGREGGFTTAGLSGNATVPWAVTKDEKRIYDDLFKSWDGFGKGYITGEQAIEIFSQSGIEKSELERIWTLSDPNNRGRLNLDEFAVAMHLIYRKLNGYPVPNRLPAELTPPSTRNLNDSIGAVKSALQREGDQRKNSGAFLQPQRTGVSYLKSHSFRQGGPGGRADATVFKNNDDNVGYKSSARRRIGGGGRSPSPAQPSSPGSDYADELTGDQLRKMIKEKQILLDAIDFSDENQAEEDEVLDRRDRRDADELYRRIRRVQEDIDRHANASKLVDGGSDAERRTLRRQLQSLTDRLPELASQVRRCERAIADAQLEFFRLKDAKAHPGAAPIAGTGPGGSVTESDRLRARAKALMQQRSAALAGKTLAPTGDDPAAAAQRLEAESSRIRTERETNERMVQDVEESVSMFSKSLEDNLRDGAVDSTTEHERRRWEEGLGVEDETRDFIYELQRESKSAKLSMTNSRSAREQSTPRQEEPSRAAASVPPPTQSKPSPASSGGGSYATYRTAEERAAYIKQQAEQRMAERLAALGIKPAKIGETPQQRAEREKKEQEERIRKAEQEDAQREQERQRRLADESIAPPTVGKSASKKPPPPPSRKTAAPFAAAGARQIERELKDEQAAQHIETNRLEEEERRQEEELAKEKEAAQSRLRALEEQVKQGKLRKEEEKKRRQVEQKLAKEKEGRLTAQRAELETARERERQLQSQLENLGDESSSDDDGPQEITPQGTTPLSTSQELSSSSSPPLAAPLPTIAAPSPPAKASPAQSVTSPPEVESKNPFLKKMQANAAENTTPPAAPPAVPTESTNPFHRLTQQDNNKSISTPDPALSRAARMKARDDDDWSVVDDSSSDDEDDGPVGGGAKQLASLLFGTMAPPRPLSAMDSPKSPPPPSSPPRASSSTNAPPAPPMPPPIPGGAPPPAPPMPGSGSAGAPPPPGPPPPPPMPGAGAAPKAPAGMPDRGALLGAINKGTRLKKVETKDRSASSVAGRVLN